MRAFKRRFHINLASVHKLQMVACRNTPLNERLRELSIQILFALCRWTVHFMLLAWRNIQTHKNICIYEMNESAPQQKEQRLVL